MDPPGRRSSPHQLHEALAALRGDDPQVLLAAVDHLSAGRRRRLGQDYFPQAVAVGYGEEARGGPGADVAISWSDGERKGEKGERFSEEGGMEEAVRVRLGV